MPLHSRFLFLAIYLTLPTWAYSETLSLQETVARVIEHNFDIAIERDNAAIAQESEITEDAAFDPTFAISSRYSENKNPIASSVLTGAQRLSTDNTSYESSLSKTFGHTGTQTELYSSINEFSTNSSNATINPDITSEVGVRLTQPLLKDRGTINLIPLMRARARSDIAMLQLRESFLDALAATENAYWELSAGYKRLSLRQSSLELAQTFYEETRKREELGLATQSDVLQAQAELASQQEAILNAQQAIEDAQDRLRLWMGALNKPINTPLQTDPMPEALPSLPDFATFYKNAFENNEALRIEQKNIHIRELETTLARNQRLPDLDLQLSGAYLGRDERLRTSLNNTDNRDAYRWSAGLSLSFPWTLRKERAEYRMAVKRQDRAEKVKAQTEQNLILEIRERWRELGTSLKRYESTQASLEFMNSAYSRERARYSEGLASFRDTLEAQRDLDNARMRTLESALNILNAHTAIKRLSGDILDTYGLSWESFKTP